MKKILVTGSGGIGGVNFVRALRATDEEFFLVGTDFNQYYLEFPDVNLRVNTPRHSDPTFLPQIKKIVRKVDLFLGELYFNLSRGKIRCLGIL